MYSIESFIHIPIIGAAVLLAILFALLVVIRCRNTAKASFVLYIALGILFAGLIRMFRSSSGIYFVSAFFASELLILPYFIILAFGDSKKREKKQASEVHEKVEHESLANISYEKKIGANEEFAAKAAELFSQDDSLNQFLDYFNAKLTEAVKADGCVILLSDEFDNFLTVRSMKGSFPPPYKLPDTLPHKPVRVEANFRYMQFQLSENIFGEVASSGEAVLIKNSVQDPRIYQNGPEDFLACGSYICVPIRVQGRIVGVSALSRDPKKEGFSELDFEHAKTLTEAAASALRTLLSFLDYSEKRSFTEEGNTAAKFQKKFILEKIPEMAGISLGAWSVQNENVCGDYYDILAVRKDRTLFVMSDVVGKGMNSFSVMVMIRTMLRMTAATPQSPAAILKWINRGLCAENGIEDHFASIALIDYNPLTRETKISTSGINPVLVYRAKTDETSQLSKQNEPLGVEKTSDFADELLQLERGDILVTCTDGLLECLSESGVQYSASRLMQVIKENHALAGTEIAERVKADVKRHSEGAQQYDDQSLLVIKIK